MKRDGLSPYISNYNPREAAYPYPCPFPYPYSCLPRRRLHSLVRSVTVCLQPEHTGAARMGTGPAQPPAGGTRTLLPLACHLLRLGRSGAMIAGGEGTAGAPALVSLAEACLQAALGLTQQGPPHVAHASGSAIIGMLGLADCLVAAVGALEAVGPCAPTPSSNATGDTASQHTAIPPADWAQLELCALTIQAVALLTQRLDYLQQQEQHQTEAGTDGSARGATDEPRRLLTAVAAATELQARVLSPARVQQLKAEMAALLEQAKRNAECMKVCRGLVSSNDCTCNMRKKHASPSWWRYIARCGAGGSHCPCSSIRVPLVLQRLRHMLATHRS